MSTHALPVIDLSRPEAEIAREIFAACTRTGFFYIKNHGVPSALEQKLERLAQEFFAWPEERKMDYAMAKAGVAWRGFFPLGGELTSGQPDWKEGLYFGEEHPADHPRVKNHTPLFGQNLFPPLDGFREAVLAYLHEMEQLSQRLMRVVALSLDLPGRFFAEHFTREPTQLFRIFHYPPPPAGRDSLWGVGEHTDYGLITILKQDTVGGLQVKTKSGWIDAPPILGTFICNIGDMLDRLTQGLYRSLPHRVKNTSGVDRYSYPYFFDPSFDAEIRILPLKPELTARIVRAESRWDEADLHSVVGTYGDYLLRKVGKVFPDLKRK